MNQKTLLMILFIVIIIIVFISVYLFISKKMKKTISPISMNTNSSSNLNITLGSTGDVNGFTYYINSLPNLGSLKDTDGKDITQLPYKLIGNVVVFNSPDIKKLTETTSFTYYANDGNNNSNIATINVLINYINHAPVSNNVNVTGMDNTNIIVQLSGSEPDTDVTGDSITYVITSLPNSSLGSLANITTVPSDIQSSSIIFIPKLLSCIQSTATFKYKIRDTKGLFSNESTVTIKINSNTTSPVLKSDVILEANYSFSQNTPVQVDLSKIVDSTGDTNLSKDKLVYFVTSTNPDTNLQVNSFEWTRLNGPIFNTLETIQAATTTKIYRLVVLNMNMMCNCGDVYGPTTRNCYSTCPAGSTVKNQIDPNWNTNNFGYTDSTICTNDNYIPNIIEVDSSVTCSNNNTRIYTREWNTSASAWDYKQKCVENCKDGYTTYGLKPFPEVTDLPGTSIRCSKNYDTNSFTLLWNGDLKPNKYSSDSKLARFASVLFSIKYTVPSPTTENMTINVDQMSIDGILYPTFNNNDSSTNLIRVNFTSSFPNTTPGYNYYLNNLPKNGMFLRPTYSNTTDDILYNSKNTTVPIPLIYDPVTKLNNVISLFYKPNPLVTIGTDNYWCSSYYVADGSTYNFTLPTGGVVVAATWGRFFRPKANILDITTIVKNNPNTDPRVGLTDPDPGVLKWVVIYYYVPGDKNIMTDTSSKYLSIYRWYNNVTGTTTNLTSNTSNITINIKQIYTPPTVNNVNLTTDAMSSLRINM